MIQQLDRELWLIVQVARVGGFRALLVLDRVRVGRRDAGMIWWGVFPDSQTAERAAVAFLRRHAAILGLSAAVADLESRVVTPGLSLMGETRRC